MDYEVYKKDVDTKWKDEYDKLHKRYRLEGENSQREYEELALKCEMEVTKRSIKWDEIEKKARNKYMAITALILVVVYAIELIF